LKKDNIAYDDKRRECLISGENERERERREEKERESGV
jgi:hypothetical protein